MTEISGQSGYASRDESADDDEQPLYLPPFGLEAVPGFCERLMARILEGDTAEAFTFDGVEVDEAKGVWMLPMGAYDPELDTEPEAAESALPPGGRAELAATWSEGVRRALREAWGEPLVRTPQLVGSEEAPAGILDVLLTTLGVPDAEMWDRGPLCVVLVTSWKTESASPGELQQIMIMLPRELVMGGMGALVDDDGVVHELLMHGEALLELRRRAWLMSTLFDAGEVRVRDATLEATRCSLQARSGTTTVWTFTEDGRALVLVHDPQCAFSTDAPQQFIDDHLSGAEDTGTADGPGADGAVRPPEPDEAAEAVLLEARLILATRMLDGMPEDLRGLIAARAEDARGEAAEQKLAFHMLGDRPVPVISGAAWFDGQDWRVSGGLLELGHSNGFGMDDFGFADAVRRPYRLGGPFTPDALSSPGTERRAMLERAFAACPYLEQARPSEAERLGYGVPSSADHPELVQQIERATEAWWERSPEDATWGDRTFRLGGLKHSDTADGTMSTVVGVAEQWTVDALKAWVDGLIDAMTARWGTALELRAHDSRTGRERRSPVARVMRGTGLMTAPMWFVNGHAVLLLAGSPDPEYSEQPQAIIVIGRADAVLDIAQGTTVWELRRRARAIGDLGALASRTPAPREIDWDGPQLEGSEMVPAAVRGGLRTADHAWTWHFTHDGRGLLMSHPVGAAATDRPAPSFDEQLGLFAGVPEDLLSLVVDRDAGGLYPTVAREDSAVREGDLLHRAAVLPAVQAVFWRDDVDWRASEGMLRRARAVGIAAAAGTGVAVANPLETIYSEAIGLPQLQWALAAGSSMGPGTLAQPQFASFVFDRPVELEEAERAYAGLGDVHSLALTGSLNGLLDVIVDAPQLRFLLEGALSNPDPRSRREIALWLLEQELDASHQLSHLTPVDVLLANPTLEAGDAPLLRQLLRAGATPGPGLVTTALAGHPLAQLVDRDADEAELIPLLDELLAPGGDDGAAVQVDARLLAYLEAGAFPHARSRSGMLARVRLHA